jgi:hypothetical protein
VLYPDKSLIKVQAEILDISSLRKLSVVYSQEFNLSLVRVNVSAPLWIAVIFSHFESPFKRSFSKIALGGITTRYLIGRGKLVKKFPWLQNEDGLCEYPLCVQVLFEQDSVE